MYKTTKLTEGYETKKWCLNSHKLKQVFIKALAFQAHEGL